MVEQHGIVLRLILSMATGDHSSSFFYFRVILAYIALAWLCGSSLFLAIHISQQILWYGFDLWYESAFFATILFLVNTGILLLIFIKIIKRKYLPNPKNNL